MRRKRDKEGDRKRERDKGREIERYLEREKDPQRYKQYGNSIDITGPSPHSKQKTKDV